MKRVNSNYLCNTCYEETLETCIDCGGRHGRDVMTYVEDENVYYCSSCLNQGVRNYSYKPTPRFYHTADPKPETVFSGIEIEMKNVKNSDNQAEARALTQKLKGFIYCKSDTSIGGGFEVVTHPFSFEWLKANKKKILQILAMRKRGFRSYNTGKDGSSGTCGMHVHISKHAFSTMDLMKYLEFYYYNKAFIAGISQRTQSELDRWASLEESGANIREKAKSKSSLGAKRSTAVNLSNEKTVEIRIFKGTLHYPSFMKNIEFVYGLLAFVKQEPFLVKGQRVSSSGDLRVTHFKDFVEKNRHIYPNLHNFIESHEL